MITLGRITQQAAADGVDADTVERDYVLTHVMASLSHHPDSDMFQFKGGTLLRLCYFNEYRYSADIDLNLEPDVDVNDAVGVLGEVLDATRERVGFHTSSWSPSRRYVSSSLDRNEQHGPGSSSSTSQQTS